MPEYEQQLIRYLKDVHSIEEQALTQLKAARKIAGLDELERLFESHMHETVDHEKLIGECLERHGVSSSAFKDLVMKGAASGFVLFANVQPDTPGKLVAHAYSYEALEEAAYAFLGEVAHQAGDSSTEETARHIQKEERRMKNRLASLFDAAAAESLRITKTEDIARQLKAYLSDAHALEAQSVQLLVDAGKHEQDPVLRENYLNHLGESRGQRELLERRIQELGGTSSVIKDAGLGLGALSWGAFFKAQPDTPGKLAAFAYAVEHLEIAGYEQLKYVSEQANDPATVALAESILRQERDAADRIGQTLGRGAQASLQAQV